MKSFEKDYDWSHIVSVFLEFLKFCVYGLTQPSLENYDKRFERLVRFHHGNIGYDSQWPWSHNKLSIQIQTFPDISYIYHHKSIIIYRARTQILKQEDGKDREKYVIKFIKIMRHLRKINNYNSYLALLSALDSAPIRRWATNHYFKK